MFFKLNINLKNGTLFDDKQTMLYTAWIKKLSTEIHDIWASVKEQEMQRIITALFANFWIRGV